MLLHSAQPRIIRLDSVRFVIPIVGFNLGRIITQPGITEKFIPFVIIRAELFTLRYSERNCRIRALIHDAISAITSYLWRIIPSPDIVQFVQC